MPLPKKTYNSGILKIMLNTYLFSENNHKLVFLMGKKKNRSLSHQLVYAVVASSRVGTPKKQFKHQWWDLDRQLRNGEIEFEEWLQRKSEIWFVPSRGDYFHNFGFKKGYKDNLVEFAKQFGKWLKENYNIKNAYEITPSMAQHFINEKAKECGVKTLITYCSYIKALNLSCAKAYGSKYNFCFAKGVKVPENFKHPGKRKLAVKDEDYNRLINYLEKNSQSRGVLAIKLARNFGLRVSELAKLRYKHIVLDNEIPRYFDREHFIVDKSPFGAYIIVEKSKGGRHRVIPALTKEQYELLKKIKEEQLKNGKDKEELIIGLKRDSINTFLRRAFKKLGMHEYVKNSVNIHGLRKARAKELFLEKFKEYYKESKETNLKKRVVSALERAGGYTNRYLGHSSDREDLLLTYVYTVCGVEEVLLTFKDVGIDEKTAKNMINEILGDRINTTGYTPEIGDIDKE
jgi:integrase